jgi:hypothetical protein
MAPKSIAVGIALGWSMIWARFVHAPPWSAED